MLTKKQIKQIEKLLYCEKTYEDSFRCVFKTKTTDAIIISFDKLYQEIDLSNVNDSKSLDCAASIRVNSFMLKNILDACHDILHWEK